MAVDTEALVAKTRAATEPTVVECMAMAVVTEGTHPASRIRAAGEIDLKSTMSSTKVQ